MSKLEKLIQQYCPDGVEYHPIWSLTAWDKKFNGVDKSKQKRVIKYNYLLAADLKSYQAEDGNVKLLTTNISNLYTSEALAGDLASEGEVVAIPWGGNPIVQYYKGRFLTADNRIATSLDTSILNNKFLYYCMLSQMKLISSFYRGSGIKHPEMAKVIDLEIPVPPLPVQEEIVRILDTFTELQAELQAELQKRKQQYNFYRDNLLSFEGRQDVEWKKLGEIASIRTGRRFVRTDIRESGVPCFHYGDIYTYYGLTATQTRGYLDAELASKLRFALPNDVVVVCAGENDMDLGVGVAWLGKEPAVVHDACCILHHAQNPRYISHFLRTHKYHLQMKKYVKNGKISSLPSSGLAEALIPIPSLEEQQRIADILDRFDTLTNDLTSGLPAEMEKRRQQYEFYRDKLLTFKRKEA